MRHGVTSVLPASSPTSLTSLAYWPPHQPPYQPSPTLLTSLHQPHLPASTNLAYQPSHQPLPLANSRWNARLRIMYIYGTYIPPLERASLSLILSSSHQAQNIIAKPLIAPSYNLSHIFLIFFTCAPLLSTAPLLCLSYCNPSCCPLASPAITILKLPPSGPIPIWQTK